MPDTPDPFDEGRAALDSIHPTTDLWAEATHRAATHEVTPLAGPSHGGHRGRWLAVAAAVALVAGTIGVLSQNDHQSVDTRPTGQAEPAPSDTTTTTGLGGQGTCAFSVTGEAIALDPGPVEPPLFGTGGPTEAQTIVHGTLGASQVAEVRVPGLVVTDLLGERVEDVELDRGTAQLWLTPDFVQVRWFPGTTAACDSFTITVAGSTTDANRHAAVALAERIRLVSDTDPPAEATPTLEGDWQLMSTQARDGVVTDASGQVFSLTSGRVTWTDGCNTFDASVVETLGRTPPTLRLREVNGTTLPCPTNPTAAGIQQVMSADSIELLFGDAHGTTTLHLIGGGTTLNLGQSGQTTVDAGFAIWPETTLADVPAVDPDRRSGAFTAISFARAVLGWQDAAVVEGQREPGEDGRPYSERHEVRSPSNDASVVVSVAPARADAGPDPWVFVVYQVDTPDRLSDPDATASVQVLSGKASAGANPAPRGATRAHVRFAYGSSVVEGRPRESLTVPSDRSAGSILVIWEGPTGVIGAWGTALPRGDFAAG